MSIHSVMERINSKYGKTFGIFTAMKPKVSRALFRKVYRHNAGNIKRVVKALNLCGPTALRYSLLFRLRDPRRLKVSKRRLAVLLKKHPASDCAALLGVSLQSVYRYVSAYGLEKLAMKTRFRVTGARITQSRTGISIDGAFQEGAKNHRWLGGVTCGYHRTLGVSRLWFQT